MNGNKVPRLRFMNNPASQNDALLFRRPDLPARMHVYLLMTGLFFIISLLTIYLLNRYCLEGRILLDSRLLSFDVITSLIALLALYYLADGMRLYLVVRAIGHRIPFRFFMKLVFVNIFFSNTTPMATGGGFVQIYFLSRKGLSIGEATAATSLRTMIASLAMLLLAPVFFILNPDLVNPFRNGNIYMYFGAVAGLYLTVVFLALFRTRTFKVIFYHLSGFLKQRGFLSRQRHRRCFLWLSRELDSFSGGFRQFIKGRPIYVMGAFMSTCLFLLVLFSFSVVLIKGLQYQVPAATILAIQSIVTFFMYFTPTPGAVGFAEGAYMLLFSRFISEYDIALLTISWRFLTIYIGVFIGILMSYRELFRIRPGRTG